VSAAIYVRVSTEEQAEHGYSLAHQREQCRGRAAELGATDVCEYADEGVSGAILDRPGLSGLRAALRARTVRLVVVHDPDRLARKLAHQLLLTDEIEAAGARLEFVNFEWRHTPEGQLFYALRGAVAQYEKAKIRERTMAGRRQKAKAGRLPSAYCPYGYTYDAARQQLVIHEAEAAVVRRMFRLLVEEGAGINGIARRLTEEGVPTRRGAPAWHRVVVRAMLHNPAYAGTFYANRMDCEGMGLNRHLPPGQRRAMRVRPPEEWIPIAVPAVVDAELWRRAQDAMDQARRLMHTAPRSDYLLSGLLTCGICALPMCGTRRRNWGTPVRGYTCRRAWSGAREPGCGRHVAAEPVEAAVWARVARWAGDAERLAEAVAHDEDGPRERAEAELRGVEEALRGAEQGRRNILAVLERHLADPGEGVAALARIGERAAALAARRDALRGSLAQAEACDAVATAARARQWLAEGGLDDLPFDRRRALVRRLVAGIRVDEHALIVDARIPAPTAPGERGPAPGPPEDTPRRPSP
jgi:site-specific DNA recombinase